MQILLVTDRLGIGGAETHILSLAKGLLALGHTPTLVSSGGALAETCGLSHHTLPLDKKDPRSLLFSLRALKKLLRSEPFDIVHAHARIPAYLLGRLRRHLNFRLVTTAHLPFPTRGLGRFSHWGEKTLAVSQDIKDHLIAAYGIPPDNIAVTVNGIDARHFAPSPKIRQHGRSLLHISRLDQDRSLTAFLLLAAVAALRRSNAAYTLTIVGGGDCLEELRQEARRLDPEGRFLFFVGPCEDPLPYLQNADAFLGVSRAALEAMACALPVILSGDEGFLGLLTPQTLPLAKESNLCCRGLPLPTAEALQKAIEELFRREPEEREALGSFGRQTVIAHYSLRRMANEAIALYTSLPPPSDDKKRRVVFCGYFGYGNTGDEAILRAEITSQRRCSPSAPITVLSASPERTAAEYGVVAVHRFSPVGVLSALCGRPRVVFGGGGLLQDGTSLRSLIYYCLLLRLAALLRCEITVYAAGIGPLTRPFSRRLVASTLQKAEVVSVRDRRSHRLLQAIGCDTALCFSDDPAYDLQPTDSERLSYLLHRHGLTPRSFILLCLRPREKGSTEALSQALPFLCSHYRSQGQTIVLLPMFPKEDSALCHTIAKKLPDALVLEGLSPREIRALIGVSSLVVGMRLHALILATAARVPCCAFAGDKKSEDFLRESGRAAMILPSIPDCGELLPELSL